MAVLADDAQFGVRSVLPLQVRRVQDHARRRVPHGVAGTAELGGRMEPGERGLVGGRRSILELGNLWLALPIGCVVPVTWWQKSQVTPSLLCLDSGRVPVVCPAIVPIGV